MNAGGGRISISTDSTPPRSGQCNYTKLAAWIWNTEAGVVEAETSDFWGTAEAAEERGGLLRDGSYPLDVIPKSGTLNLFNKIKKS